jgi:hypothetical protein
MKKLFTTPEYKLYQSRKNLKIEKKLRKKGLSKIRRRKLYLQEIERQKQERQEKSIYNVRNKSSYKLKKKNVINPPVFAPEDFRLIENTEECLLFFRNIRNEENINTFKNLKIVLMSMKYVTQIDYGTTSILTAISDDLKYKGIVLKGDFPSDPKCKKFIIDSGILNHMVDERGNAFPKPEKSDLIFFEKGCGVLSTEDNKKISQMVMNVVNHLTGESKYCLPVKTIILEICGNSIEWGGTDNRQWLFGVKYEDEKVIFTVTDVGKGILDTLYRKFKHRITDVFTIKPNDEILKGAFNKKYGSNTQEINRNKGLPSVKSNFEQGTIKELKVLTNNVILHFDDDVQSKAFEKGKPRFKGTFYQWSMSNECINNISIGSNESN